jgi:hypothetical protein
MLCLSKELGIPLACVAAEHSVHLLESGILGLGKHPPDPEDADKEEDREEDIGAPLPGLEHGRHEESDGEVIDPAELMLATIHRTARSCLLAEGSDGGALSTNGQREDLGHQSPADRAPGGPESSNVDPDKSWARVSKKQ